MVLGIETQTTLRNLLVAVGEGELALEAQR
jgi:hypothetical protein